MTKITLKLDEEALQDLISTSGLTILKQDADSLAESAKALCPVKTGKLRDSIEVTIEKDKAIVSANTDYATIVELGSSTQAGQHYLQGALIQNGI